MTDVRKPIPDLIPSPSPSVPLASPASDKAKVKVVLHTPKVKCRFIGRVKVGLYAK